MEPHWNHEMPMSDVDVVIGELPKLTGSDAEGDNAWRELSSWIQGLDQRDTTTLLVGLAALVVVFGLRVVAPKVPGALVLVVGGLVASGLFDLGAHGVALVGDVPSGLPAPALPDGDLFADHLATIGTAAFGLLLVGFSQTAGDARAFATRHGYRVDVNQETLAQGMANLGAGAFQGMAATRWPTTCTCSTTRSTSRACAARRA
jgi:SulP family sulfate permease